MDIKDFAAITGGRLVKQLGESLELAIAPRLFIRRVENETPTDTWLRVLTLALCFSALELALFSLLRTTPAEWTTLEFLGVSAVEVAMGAISIPVFYLVARYLRSSAPIRIAAAYALTFRFVFLVPLLFLMFLFLSTENYAFALLKGFAVWMYLVVFVLMYPLVASRSIRQRLTAIGLCMILNAVARYGVARLASLPHRGSGVIMPLLADPIGDEVDRAHTEWSYISPDAPLGKFYDSYAAVAKAERHGSMLIGPAGLQAKYDYVLSWPRRAKLLDSSLTQEISRLRSAGAQAQFETTRYLIQANIAMLEKMRDAARASVRLGFRNDATTVTDFYQTRLQAMDAQITGADKYIEHLRVRRQLESWYLLECECTDSANR